MDHYFTDNRNLPSNRKEISFRFSGLDFSFVVDNGVFSKTEVDFGSWVLLDTIKDQSLKGEVLDLGCGYGVIGIVTKKLFPEVNVLSADVNPRAVELANLNKDKNGVLVKCVVSDIFENIPQTFDHILLNPPIRAGKKVIYQMFDEAYVHLNKGGCLWIVIRKQQGAESAQKHLLEKYKNCELVRKEKGYWILLAKLTD